MRVAYDQQLDSSVPLDRDIASDEQRSLKMLSNLRNWTLGSYKNYVQWSNFDTACLIFAFLSVGKEPLWRTTFASLMFIFAFLSILRPVMQTSRAGHPVVAVYVMALSSAIKVGITSIYAGFAFAVSFYGETVSPAEWQKLLVLLSTLMIQFAGLAGLVTVMEELWRTRHTLNGSIETFKRRLFILALTLSMSATAFYLAWCFLQLSMLAVLRGS